VMVVTDRLTKMVRCVPMTTTVTAPEVAEMFVWCGCTVSHRRLCQIVIPSSLVPFGNLV
jgi:hypothetical protein